jgi:transposase
MDSRIASHHVSRLEIVETGRRRRWSASEKLRIVEESYSAPRQGSATARRHGISNQLLNLWRKAAREGRLGIGPVNGFVPALVVPEVTSDIGRAAAGGSRMEVISTNGRRVIFDRDVDVEVLVRVVHRLEALR